MKKYYILGLLTWLLITGFVYGKVKDDQPQFEPHLDVYAPRPKRVTQTIELQASSTATVNIPEYNLVYFDTLKGQGDCLVLRDSDGVGETYITALNGLLISKSTGC